MTVVADAGPLRYLILIGQIQVLRNLFHHVLVPESVRRELSHHRTPTVVKEWVANLPHWLVVHKHPLADVPGLDYFDDGERDAIALARKSGISLFLVDDGEGRAAAVSFGLGVLGTIGILERAAQSGLLSFADAFAALEKTNFHMSASFRQLIRKRHGLNI
jgi:predicted nucleic acid-binding protein